MKQRELNILAFVVTLACAVLFRWEARDLVWGLWASSLCVGYATLVVTIVRGALFSRRKGEKERLRDQL